MPIERMGPLTIMPDSVALARAHTSTLNDTASTPPKVLVPKSRTSAFCTVALCQATQVSGRGALCRPRSSGRLWQHRQQTPLFDRTRSRTRTMTPRSPNLPLAAASVEVGQSARRLTVAGAVAD